MQRVLVMYDVSEDRPRTKIADACLDYGLDRLQYSIFCGKLSRRQQDELFVRLEELLAEGAGKIHLIPISEDDWNKRCEVNYA